MTRDRLRQVPLYLLPAEWLAVQQEANRRELVPVEVLRRWIAPHLADLIKPSDELPWIEPEHSEEDWT